MCLEGHDGCFELQDVLGPSLVALLDPPTLPRDGSRYWCDRSGNGHHALIATNDGGVLVEADGRSVADGLARSLRLEGGWLSIDDRGQPLFASEDFAVVIAAATPVVAPGDQALDLFESGGSSRIGLRVQANTSLSADAGPNGFAVARAISAPDAGLIVRTASSVYDGDFHLYTLSRRSQVQIQNDVLQLRLNGVLEARESSIAIPGTLDLSSGVSRATWLGRSDDTSAAAPGNGRLAAVVILKDSVPAGELGRLEAFLCAALAVCAPPRDGVAP